MIPFAEMLPPSQDGVQRARFMMGRRHIMAERVAETITTSLTLSY